MKIMIDQKGTLNCVYDEMLQLDRFGPLQIKRGSHVEPNSEGQWNADLSPCDGPVLGPFQTRSEALEAEHQWLEQFWLESCFAGNRPDSIRPETIPLSNLLG